MKKIPEQKLQAFSAGSMGARNLSKKELEELRKKEEEEAAAHVFKEFVETFQEAPSTTSKVWVKAGTYDAGARKEDNSERGKLYKPVSRFEDKRPSAEEVVRSLAQRSGEQGRLRAKQGKDKKKSNLELFKEELRQIQEERSERHKYKNVLRERGAPVGAEPVSLEMLPDVGSYDTGDPNTTNLYLGNLNPKITEQQLMEIFGRYGPLASIKIMWPRSDEEKARGRNCGFVAFMSRRDGERALRCINGKEIMSYEMKLGWGKAVVIPPVPIYIPPALQTPCAPPPPSGLPFNAQPPKHRLHKVSPHYIYSPPALQTPCAPPPPSGLPFNAQPPKHRLHKVSPHYIYSPPALQTPCAPPPPSGLPFNAQPPKHRLHKVSPHYIYSPPALQTPCAPPPPSGLPFNAQPPKHRLHKVSPHYIYSPPALQTPCAPPPPSGLPFNAQPPKHRLHKVSPHYIYSPPALQTPCAPPPPSGLPFNAQPPKYRLHKVSPHYIYSPPALQTPCAPPPPSGLPFNAQPPKHRLHKVSPHYIYSPPALQTPCAPPPPSGLPFNAQPPKHRLHKIPRVRPGEYYPSDPEDRQAYEEILCQSIVKVVVPTERNILMLIHRMVEFVIREGPMFEAMIMNKELSNPFFRFLFENQSPAHAYYRWKLFSMLQGDSPKQWATNDFRMFKDGSVWRPPVMNLYTAGMPDELVDEDETKESIRGTLSNNQRDRLEELIRGLTPTRAAVGEAMAWCLEHAEAAGEVAACLAEALGGEDTAPHKRIARLYLMSDILHNAGAKLTNASAFRSAIQSRLLDIMRDCHLAWSRMSSRLQQEGFRARVTRILQAWADWAVYPAELLLAASEAFRGRADADKIEEMENIDGVSDLSGGSSPASTGSWERGGAGPLDGAALRRLAAGRPPDIDGVPVEEEEDIDGVPLEADKPRAAGGFIPSRWESVEPEPAWPEPAPAPPPPPLITPQPPEISNTSSMTEELSLKRETLRDIEVKVLKYADELEAGLRARRAGLSAPQQLQHYRRKLIKKASREAKEAVEEALESPSPRRRLSPEDDTYSISSKKSKKSRDASLSPPVKRRHSERKSRSRSRERDHRRRRSPATPPAHHHRKHTKHAKYKY